MRIAILAFVFAALILQASGTEFSRATKYESVQAFLDTAKSFEPATTKGEMAALFTVKEMGQREDQKTGTPVPAKGVDSCKTLYAGDSLALVLVKAQPPTEATRSVAAVLFLLKHDGPSWWISDLLRFEACGKYSEIKATLSAMSYNGKSDPGFLTVTEFHGGRGYSYDISASYKCQDCKFKRVDLE